MIEIVSPSCSHSVVNINIDPDCAGVGEELGAAVNLSACSNDALLGVESLPR